jgi:hypothetical protein
MNIFRPVCSDCQHHTIGFFATSDVQGIVVWSHRNASKCWAYVNTEHSFPINDVDVTARCVNTFYTFCPWPWVSGWEQKQLHSMDLYRVCFTSFNTAFIHILFINGLYNYLYWDLFRKLSLWCSVLVETNLNFVGNRLVEAYVHRNGHWLFSGTNLLPVVRDIEQKQKSRSRCFLRDTPLAA